MYDQGTRIDRNINSLGELSILLLTYFFILQHLFLLSQVSWLILTNAVSLEVEGQYQKMNEEIDIRCGYETLYLQE